MAQPLDVRLLRVSILKTAVASPFAHSNKPVRLTRYCFDGSSFQGHRPKVVLFP